MKSGDHFWFGASGETDGPAPCPPRRNTRPLGRARESALQTAARCAAGFRLGPVLAGRLLPDRQQSAWHRHSSERLQPGSSRSPLCTEVEKATGILATQDTLSTAGAHRPRKSLRQWRLPSAGGELRHNDVDEQASELLGQRGHGELRQDAQDRADLPSSLRHPSLVKCGHVDGSAAFWRHDLLSVASRQGQVKAAKTVSATADY